MRLPSRKSMLLKATLLMTAAAVCFAWVVFQRRAQYLVLAEHHQAEMATYDSVSRNDGQVADMYEGRTPKTQVFAFLMPVGDTKEIRASEAMSARRAKHHAALSLKYKEAADRPWLAVQPDPPSP